MRPGTVDRVVGKSFSGCSGSMSDALAEARVPRRGHDHPENAMEQSRQTSPRFSLPARAHSMAHRAALVSVLIVGVGGLTTRAHAATTPTTRPPVVASTAVQSAAPTLPTATATKTTRAAATTKATTKRKAATTKRKAATTRRPSTATTSFRVSGAGQRGVAVRSAPGVAATAIGRKAEGVALRISCQVKGEVVRDAKLGRASALWDKLVTGGYVANVYTTAYNAKTVGYTTGLHRCTGTIPAVPKRTTATTVVAAVGAATGKVAAIGVTTTAP